MAKKTIVLADTIGDARRRQIAGRLGAVLDALKKSDRKNTRVHIANALGIGKSAVSNWTRRANPDLPTLENLVALCERFSLSIDYIVFGVESRPINDGLMAKIDSELARRRPHLMRKVG